MDMYDKINELHEKRGKIERGGGKERINQQYEKGKKTARERIRYLLDAHSFIELNPFMESRAANDKVNGAAAQGESVVTGYGTINKKPVYLFAHDFTVYGGALGEMHAKKIVNVMDKAAENGVPFISINDSGGARIQEGVAALDGFGKIFYRNAIYSGVIPQISVIMGPSAGGAAYSTALTDIVIMVDKTAKMFITGPKVLEKVTGEKISAEDLGGAYIHTTKSGNAHLRALSEEQALDMVKTLLSYLPSHKYEQTPEIPCDEIETEMRNDLLEIVPYDTTQPYDVKKVIAEIVDKASFFELHEGFAKNIVVGFARMKGKSVGVVCNQPKYMAGGIDIDSSDKAARFIRFCDAFHVPIITLEDVTGFLPGIKQEHAGIIRHGAKIIYAYAEATVPKITVILRKAYGGAYVALNSKSIGADLVFSWPNAEIAVMGPEGAVNIIYAKEIAESEHPEQTRQEKMYAYKKSFANPYHAASLGVVDDIIDPRETRIKLLQGLEMLYHKKQERPQKKHGNIPL